MRPADGGGDGWWPLSQNGDPAKGDPGALAAHAAAYAKIATQAASVSKALTGLCVDEFWDSDSGTAFKVRCDNLAAELGKIVSRYQTAADALHAYLPDLEHAQSTAASARTLGDTAQGDFAAIGYTYNPSGALAAPVLGVPCPFAPVVPPAKPMSPQDPNWNKYQTAAQEWNTAVHRVGDAAHLHDTSASTAARKIKAVAEGDGVSNQHWTALDAQQRGFLSLLTDPGTVESAVLNLPLTNANGEQNGGVNPNLPIDPAVLQALLDDLRAKNVDPKQYKALLDQYWVATAAQHAGINLNEWDPSAGTGPNQGNIQAVYTYYGKLFLDHPELQWAGMANMIGPSFAGGFMDIDMFRKMAQEFADKLDSLPAAARAALPPDLQLLAKGSQLTSAELQYFESKFLGMQKHIFFDQAAAHEAYLAGPPNNRTAYIDEMQRAGLFAGDVPPDKTANAWHAIANPHSTPQQIMDANTTLLYREQNVVIKDQYNQMYNHDGPVGKVFTYMMTTVGAASIPGTHTPGEYRPLTFGGDVNVPVIVGTERVGVHVTTPLPDFNITNTQDRWDYVTHDTLPAYQKLLQDHPDQARQIIATPVQDRIAQQRLSARWPTIADDLLYKDWHVKVDHHLTPAW
ncbi:MAG: hypothetical protein ACJ786_20930 [Catenulispora sp.]